MLTGTIVALNELASGSFEVDSVNPIAKAVGTMPFCPFSSTPGVLFGRYERILNPVDVGIPRESLLEHMVQNGHMPTCIQLVDEASCASTKSFPTGGFGAGSGMFR